MSSPVPVADTVLQQALGTFLAEDEQVVAAAFVGSVRGRMLRTGVDWTGIDSLVVMTDRRLIRVIAWSWNEAYGGSESPDLWGAMAVHWKAGTLLPGRASLTRRSLWLGDVRDAGVRIDPVRFSSDRLVIQTVLGEVTLRGPQPELRVLERALIEALAGPGRHTLAPPSPLPPVPVGGWGARIIAILRPARPERDRRPGV